jgi:hypothetical protein
MPAITFTLLTRNNDTGLSGYQQAKSPPGVGLVGIGKGKIGNFYD